MAEDDSAISKTAPMVSKELFGGILEGRGAGNLPGIELLNFVFCSVSEDLLPDSESIEIYRRSCDFGRRLVWDTEHFRADPRWEQVLLSDTVAEETLKELLKSLQLVRKNARSDSDPHWTRIHFFPYTQSLIHWDNRQSGQKSPYAERQWLRGGGALAFKILRTDKNPDRLSRIRSGFRNLYSATSESPLERLAAFIKDQSGSDRAIDDIERDSRSINDHLEELFRDGISTILGQNQSTSVAKIKAVIGWTGLCLAIMENRRANAHLDLESDPIIVDCGSTNPQLRRFSQRCHKNIENNLLAAVNSVEPNLSKTQKNHLKGFFAITCASIGFLNAFHGRRHFTFSVDCLEMIVMATIESGKEMPFEKFLSDIIFEKLGMVVGRRSAERSGLISSIDASVFEENESQLAKQMIAAGLVKQYSDATRMVRIESGF